MSAGPSGRPPAEIVGSNYQANGSYVHNVHCGLLRDDVP